MPDTLDADSQDFICPNETVSLILALAFSLCVPALAVDGRYFTDVEPDAWYYDAVRWAADEGVVEGYPDGSFGVNRICTQQEAITMLWRAAGRVETGTGTKDSEKAMAWLERQSGEDLDFYRAGAPVTRADYVMILYTALGDLVDLPAELPFTDLEGIVDDEEDALCILDQTKLPGKAEMLSLKTQEEIWTAIHELRSIFATSKKLSADMIFPLFSFMRRSPFLNPVQICSDFVLVNMFAMLW